MSEPSMAETLGIAIRYFLILSGLCVWMLAIAFVVIAAIYGSN